MDKKKLYMAVTPDEYELPLYVADTCVELAEKFGVTGPTVYSAVSKRKDGSRRGVKFLSVEIENESE